MIDNINRPTHYHSNGTDVIGFAEAQFNKEEQKGFHRINAIKYITRYDRKNGIEDLNKAKFYIDKLIELETPKKESKYTLKADDTCTVFMRSLADIAKKASFDGDIKTYRAGTNPND